MSTTITKAMGVLCVLLIVAGCSTTAVKKRAHNDHSKVSPVLQNSRSVQQADSITNTANLQHIRDIAMESDTDGVDRIAISPEGKWIAVIGHGGAFDWLRVYSVADGKKIYELIPKEYGLVDVKWNLDGSSLAFYGATGEPMGREMHADRGIGFVGIRTGKVKRFTSANLREDESIAWLPDGVRVISDNMVVNMQTEKQEGILIDPSQPYGFNRGITVSKDWVLAGEYKRGTTEPPEIDILRAKPGKMESFAKVAKLGAERNSVTKAVTMFRTQPAFMDDGRLAYVKVFLNSYGAQEKVEIWTSNDAGKDEQFWITLPRVGIGASNFSITPISWSSDGSILTYVERSTLKVFKADSSL